MYLRSCPLITFLMMLPFILLNTDTWELLLTTCLSLVICVQCYNTLYPPVRIHLFGVTGKSVFTINSVTINLTLTTPGFILPDTVINCQGSNLRLKILPSAPPPRPRFYSLTYLMIHLPLPTILPPLSPSSTFHST